MTGRQNGVFFIHWLHYLMTAYEAKNRTAKLIAVEPHAMPPDALVAIVFSALSVEAFVNEIGEMAGRDLHHDISGVAVDQLRDLAATLTEIEESQGSVELKYQMMGQILSGRAFDRGKQPFQGFRNLMRLRNDLVHLRHRDRTDAAGYISPIAPVARMLQQKGLTRTAGRKTDEPPGGMSWLNELETTGSATWAYEAARNIISAIGDMLPEDLRTLGIEKMKRQILELPRG